jgi:hypothetical protein
MITDAQRDAHTALCEAIEDAPQEHVLNWLYTALSDDLRLSGQLEHFGNRIGLSGHLKTRETENEH